MEININNRSTAKADNFLKDITVKANVYEAQDLVDNTAVHMAKGDELTITENHTTGLFDNDFYPEVTGRVIRRGKVADVINGRPVIDWVLPD